MTSSSDTDQAALDPTDKQALDTLLRQAQLHVAEDDYAVLLRTFGWLREQMATLRLPAARYAEPAVHYSPTARVH